MISIKKIVGRETKLGDASEGNKSFFKRITVAAILFVSLIIIIFGAMIYGFHKDTYAVQTAARVVPYPAAFVNKSVVTLRDFYFTRMFTEHFYVASKLPYDKSTIGNQILDQLIDQKIVSQHASSEGIKITQSEIEQAYNKLNEKNGKEEVRKVLSDLYGLSESQFKELISHEVLKQKIEASLKEKGRWHQVQVRHLLIKVEQNAEQKAVDGGKQKAEDNIVKIKGGKSFDEIAKANSEDVESKDQGGELGFLSRGQTVKEFEDAAFGAKKGDIVGPIRTQYGWHVLLVEDIRGDSDYKIWHDEAKIYKLIKP